jgi:hypothetical protein
MRLHHTTLISFLIVACSCAHDGAAAIPLKHTPLLVPTPKGFVHNPWISTDSPSVHFRLPKGPDGGTPGYPQLSVTQINPIREPDSLSSYVAKLQSNENANVFSGPNTGSVLSQPAIEIATEWTTIYDFADGTAASGQTTREEIIFELDGRFYICELLAYPEIHSKWVSSLRRLCQSLRSTTQPTAAQPDDEDRREIAG